MITIGRRYSGPRRNYAAPCDYCGVMWHRHELTLDGDGRLACPDDHDGRAVKELDLLRAEGAMEPLIVRGKTRDP